MKLAKIAALVTSSLFVVGFAALLWPGVRARAQVPVAPRRGARAALKRTVAHPRDAGGCQTLSAVVHAVLPSSTPMAATDSWGGPLYGMVGDECLGVKAALSGNDGEETWYEDGNLGVGKGGSYTVCSDYPGCQNTFTYEVPFAVFPTQPGALMDYIAYGVRIVKGTGRFAGATGSLDVRGPSVSWPDDNPLQWAGGWAAQITGTICGIQ